MKERCISQECLNETGFSYTLSLINGKYKMTILYALMEFKVVRFNEMKRYIGGISYKTLSSTLKEFHVINVGGLESAALGSDFDGIDTPLDLGTAGGSPPACPLGWPSSFS